MIFSKNQLTVKLLFTFLLISVTTFTLAHVKKDDKKKVESKIDLQYSPLLFQPLGSDFNLNSTLAGMNPYEPRNPVLLQNGNFRVSGFGNIDVIPKTMQKTLAGEERNYVALANAGMNIDAHIKSALNAHIGVAYYHANKGQGNYQNTKVLLDEAYFLLYDPKSSPYFARAGLFYLPFGVYNRYDIVPTLGGVLSISRAPALQVGVEDWNGLSASAYVAQGQVKQGTRFPSTPITTNGGQNTLNGGLALGYLQKITEEARVAVGVQYMFNMLNVNALAESDGLTNTQSGIVNNPNHVFSQKMPGIAAQIKLEYKEWVIFAQLVNALSGSIDIIQKYTTPTTPAGPVFGAKPQAWDVGGLYQFDTFGYKSHVDFTYSGSKEMAGLYIFNSWLNHGVPKTRYVAGYSIFFNEYVMTRFQWAHDWLYNPGAGDIGRQGDAITIRLGFAF